MPHYQFPTNYVYWQQIDEHKDIKQRLLPIIRKIEEEDLVNPFNACTMKTSIKRNNNFLSNEEINILVWKPIDTMINEINSIYNFKIKPSDSILQKYWFNTYNVGDFQEMHYHLGHPIYKNNKIYIPTFSLIYILNEESETNSTVFYSQNQGTHQPFVKPFQSDTFDTSKVSDIKEGTVIIFPCGLHHLVKPNRISGRTTLAFNIYSSFD